LEEHLIELATIAFALVALCYISGLSL